MKYIENILKRKRNLIRKESKNRNRIKSRNAPKRPPKLVSRRSHKLPPQACFQIDSDWMDFPANQKSRIFLKPPRAIYPESVPILYVIRKKGAISEILVLVKNGREKRIL